MGPAADDYSIADAETLSFCDAQFDDPAEQRDVQSAAYACRPIDIGPPMFANATLQRVAGNAGNDGLVH